MIWTLTTNRPDSAGRPNRRTHYLIAQSLTQAIRRAAGLIRNDSSFIISNLLRT